jgi:hypothetical protein
MIQVQHGTDPAKPQTADVLTGRLEQTIRQGQGIIRLISAQTFISASYFPDMLRQGKFEALLFLAGCF